MTVLNLNGGGIGNNTINNLRNNRPASNGGNRNKTDISYNIRCDFATLKYSKFGLGRYQ